MEKRLTKKLDTYSDEIKSNITTHLAKLKSNNETISNEIDDILKYVNSIKPLIISKEDLMKRKRTKNSVALSDRCCACRANGEQCSRRKKDDSDYCGTHIKGVPYGVVKIDSTSLTTKREVWTEDIGGIIYYIDSDFNVYKHEDIMNNKINPSIIGKCKKDDGKYKLI